MTKLRHLAIPVACLLALAACGGKDESVGISGGPLTTPSASAEPPSSTPEPTSTPDLYPAGTTSVTFTQITHLPYPNATCTAPDQYELDLAANTLVYAGCDNAKTSPASASATLTAAQLAPITSALHSLRLDTTPQTYCGDEVDQIVTFHGTTDTTLYGQFRYCSNDGKTYVTGTDVVLSTLGTALH